MTKTYRVGPGQRVVNVVFKRLATWGFGARYLHILTVTGRTSGLARSVPIDVMDIDGDRYLVAPYGEVNWVRNLRVAKRATLRRGRRVQTCETEELSPDQAIPVIRQYIRAVPVTRRYWEIDEHAADEKVREAAKNHPVFHVSRATP